VVDNFGTPGASPGEPVDVAVDADKRTNSFLGTTLGKIVVGGAIVVVVLAALGAIAYFFMFSGSEDSGLKNPIVTTVETSSTVPGAEEGTPTPRPEPPLEDTFAFRNIFMPTIQVTLSPVEGDGTSSSSGNGSTADVPADTLFLAGVSEVDGEPVAELIWNGQTYSLSEGESIPGTPWQVLSISGDTVVMLFGDTRVTLTVGQGISK